MSLQNRDGPYLPLLRSLQAKGSIAELLALVNRLKKKGYPSSILRAFELGLSQDSPTHPYCYQTVEPVRHLGQIVPSALVSIIIVVYDSANDLKNLLQTLRLQSYANHELIIVNNGQEDLSDLLLSYQGKVQLINADNPGFAEANNIGLEKASGDLLLLLNPDTELQHETLKELVHSLEIDSSAAAAIPLIYFSRPFSKLSITNIGQGSFAVDEESLLKDLHYKKLFVRDGERRDDGLIYCNARQYISFDIALNAESNWLDFDVLSIGPMEQERCLKLAFAGSGEKAELIVMNQQRKRIRVSISKRTHSSSRYLINNAGSALHPGTFTPYDLGFAEVDHGQFSTRAYRDALCGCCALLRRDLFIKRKIFIREFFAYYEDSELSYWLRANHMNILFVPSAIVYHRHSEITVENSPLWNYLVSRSAKIYAWIRNSLSSNDNPVSPMLPAVPSSASQQLIDTLGNYDQLINRHSIEELISRTKRFTVGIYNSYWSSFGGGERHALDLADIACKANCEVYLISESPFSLDKLQRFFNIRLDGVKTLVPGEVTESLTERFDIFINSTFCSTLVSRSEISYYITSFPQRNVPRDFASAYVFLHNSSYTSRWALRYWGEHRQKLLLPVLSFASLTLDEDSKPQSNRLAQCKEFVILSVGRFNYEGHCKNQHIIASVFSALCQAGEIAPQWQLVIAGAVDSHVHSSLSHFEATTKRLEGCNARVIPNADRSQIKNLYHSASIYMNAAGLGADPVNAPEKSEHFGIAAFEALLYGCRLVSYEHGGPALMIENSIGGSVFTHQEEMSIKLLQAISACELENSQDRESRIQHNFDYCNKKIDEALYLAHSLFPSSSAML